METFMKRVIVVAFFNMMAYCVLVNEISVHIEDPVRRAIVIPAISIIFTTYLICALTIIYNMKKK